MSKYTWKYQIIWHIITSPSNNAAIITYMEYCLGPDPPREQARRRWTWPGLNHWAQTPGWTTVQFRGWFRTKFTGELCLSCIHFSLSSEILVHSTGAGGASQYKDRCHAEMCWEHSSSRENAHYPTRTPWYTRSLAYGESSRIILCIGHVTPSVIKG